MKISLGLSGMVYWEIFRVYCVQLNKTVKELHIHPGSLPLPLHPDHLNHPTVHPHYTMATSIITPLYTPTTPWPPQSSQTKQGRVERNENQIITNIQLSVPPSQVLPYRKWHHTLCHKISFKNSSVTRKKCRYDLHAWGDRLGKEQTDKVPFKMLIKPPQ